MQDLNDLVDPSSGWVLTAAYGINDAGQIVGTVYESSDRSPYIYSSGIATRIPNPFGGTRGDGLDINNNGAVVGFFSTGTGNCFEVLRIARR